MTQRGFTLVELLVALFVTALLGLMSWRGLDGMSNALQKSRTRADEIQVLQNGLMQWGADLDAMAARQPTAIDWDGKVLRITRTSAAGGPTGLQVVAWTTRNSNGLQQWARWLSPVVQTSNGLTEAWERAALWGRGAAGDGAGGAGGQAGEVAIVPVRDWRIFYYRNDGWSNALSSADAGNSRPDGVRLELELEPGHALAGKITRDWVSPTMVRNRS